MWLRSRCLCRPLVFARGKSIKDHKSLRIRTLTNKSTITTSVVKVDKVPEVLDAAKRFLISLHFILTATFAMQMMMMR